MMSEWKYKEKLFTDCQDYYGFVYSIQNKTNGKTYIGRKYFTSAGYKQVKGKRKKIRKSSGWENYWGSNEKLKEDVKLLGKENFKRTILHLCKSRSECQYWETAEIFLCHALVRESFYNQWVSCRINAKNVNSLQL